MTDHMLTRQDIRNQALAAELEALRAQCAAINALDTEHAFALEHTFTAKRILSRVEALVELCQSLQLSIAAEEGESLVAIEDFRQTAEAIKAAVKDFNGWAQTNAEGREQRALTQHEMLSPGSRELATGADKSCCQAEVGLFESFVLQVTAICELCLELLYNAAGEAQPE